MKRFVLTVIVGFIAAFAAAQVPSGDENISVMFWNLENFFDWKDGGHSSSDAEFSTNGERRWSSRRFYAKCNAIAKTLLWTADTHGQLPDAFGVAEVENADVLRRLLNHTILYKYDYGVLHADSPDPRGIDVALLYRKSRLQLLSWKTIHIDEFKTRDILLATFITTAGDTLNMVVNHHPSKYGGSISEGRRHSVMKRMVGVCDSLESLSNGQKTLCMGDFNDTPDAETFLLAEKRLVNLAVPFHQRGEGTIRFDGKWEIIDMFLVSPSMADGRMEILYPPFLMVRDNSHSGMKPLRTYLGPRYMGGVSDHLPIYYEKSLTQ